jgi:hypothetical protein
MVHLGARLHDCSKSGAFSRHFLGGEQIPNRKSGIATQLGVTHKTISKDLSEFVPEVQTQPRTSKRGRMFRRRIPPSHLDIKMRLHSTTSCRAFIVRRHAAPSNRLIRHRATASNAFVADARVITGRAEEQGRDLVPGLAAE